MGYVPSIVMMILLAISGAYTLRKCYQVESPIACLGLEAAGLILLISSVISLLLPL